jgi:hypothetical protein
MTRQQMLEAGELVIWIVVTLVNNRRSDGDFCRSADEMVAAYRKRWMEPTAKDQAL